MNLLSEYSADAMPSIKNNSIKRFMRIAYIFYKKCTFYAFTRAGASYILHEHVST